MKVTRFYDIQCDECSRWLSTDFNTGMFYNRESTIKAARDKGFRDVKGQTLCPVCLGIEQSSWRNSSND